MEIKAAAGLKSGFRIAGNRILLAQPVMLDGKREGTLYLVADLHAMSSQLLKTLRWHFSRWVLRRFASSRVPAFRVNSCGLSPNPILSLAGIARTIAHHHDYSVRATKVCGDEVGGVDRRVQPDADANPVSG